MDDDRSRAARAFQKGKSTLLQIFIHRLIIEICKKRKLTIYIAFVDLEKAFDKVSRFLFLARLVTLAISNEMLGAPKRIYSCTCCILCFYGCYSEVFVTRTGIRQRSASTVFLFIFFMDGLFSFLRAQCQPEDIIGSFHALVYADDTLIMSTNRDRLIHKCNQMMIYLEDNRPT